MRIEVDDNDSSVKYFGSWSLSGDGNEFQSTTHYTSSAGAQLSLTFEGISIEVYGTTTPFGDFPGAVSRYLIDGTSISTYNSPTTATTPGYHTQFFKSPTLSNGRHSLLVTSLAEGTLFYVDYFVIVTQDEVKSESAPPPSDPQPNPQGGRQGETHTATKQEASIFTSSPSLSTSDSTLHPPSSPPLPSPLALPPSSSNVIPNADQGSHTATDSQPSPTTSRVSQSSPEATAFGPSPSKPVPIGAIVGATAAGVLVVVLILFFLWRHRRRSAKHVEFPKRPVIASVHTDAPGATPFVVSQALEAAWAGSPRSLVYPGDHVPAFSPFFSAYNPSEGRRLLTLETSPFTDPTSSSDRKGVQNNSSTSSTPSDGRVRKSSRYADSASSPTSAQTPPATPSSLEARAQNPPSPAQNEGSIFEYHQDMMDNLPPPAYYAVHVGLSL